MPRIAREKGEFSTYHIILRGNERKNIFLQDDDKIRFLNIMSRMMEKYNFILESYCLMDNHVHLLINDNGNDISKIIKSINVSYAYYFNHNYKRVGHLFQDRFKSEIVENDNYLLALTAYIHNNPVKARIVRLPEEYKWSSFKSYLGKDRIWGSLVNVERVLGIMSGNRKEAMAEYYKYVLKYDSTDFIDEVMDIEEDKILLYKENADYIDSLGAAQELVDKILRENEISLEDLKANKNLRYELMSRLRKNSSLTLKEIGELCGGLSQSMVCKILKA
ncbi:MAG: transposase [Bacillota bacterium]|jgi:putative transposase